MTAPLSCLRAGHPGVEFEQLFEPFGVVARRTAHPRDGRRVIVKATAKGRRVVDAIMPQINREERLMTADLDESERDELSRLLRKVLRTLDDLD